MLERDRGLARRMGAVALAAAVFNTVVGAGIYVIPASLARDVGAAAPFAYLACVASMGAVALCFAAAASRAPSSGGPYGFVEAAFGPFAGFVVGVLVWLGAVLAAAGIASAVAQGAARFLPVLAGPAPRAAIILALFAGLAAVNVAGVTPGSRLVGLLTVVKIAPLLILIALALPHLGGGRAAAAPARWGGFGRAMILALFAFQGMETALGVSGEVSEPARNVPRGLLGAMGAVALLYIGVQASAQGLLGSALAGSAAPLAEAVGRVAPPLVQVMLAGALVSMLGYLASDTLSAPRVLFAFARDGLLPAGLGAVHPKTHAPHRAIWLHAAIGAGLALSGSFVELAVLSSLATVVVYAAGCLAAWRLQRRDVRLAGAPLRVAGLGIVAGVGVVSMGWIAAQARPAEAIGCLLAAGCAALWFLAVKRRRPVPA